MKNEKKITQILAFFLVIIIAMNLYLMINNYSLLKSVQINSITSKHEPAIMKEEKLNSTDNPYSLKDYVDINIDIKPGTIILNYNCSSISLPLNDLQVYSIKNALEKRIDIRPTVHDTIKALMDNYNISLELVKITEIKGDVFLSNLIFKRENEVLNIDSKPSDSIALALRTGNKIYIKKEIIDREGKKVC